MPIGEIAAKLGIPEPFLDYYGPHTAKLRLELIESAPTEGTGKLILVTAMTPTTHGEGKTVVSIGLAQALERHGKRSCVTLREPSLGPVFGVKGGATGGGRAQVLPSERINLHFNGDFHAVSSAHNLLAAMIDAHLHHGNDLKIDVDNIFWPRAIDMNDRALRHIIVGLGGKANGVPRESGFVITAASEIMAILALTDSREDCRRRLSQIAIGFDLDGRIVHAGDLKATGALMVLLHEAIMPNLVQTSEHTPALVHAGPFANIAHGTSSVLAQKVALRYADYVVNEAGFGADLGAEKYFDIVMPSSGLKPSVAVLVATCRGVQAQSGFSQTSGQRHAGLANLAKHIENLRKFGVPVVMAINRFPQDTDQEMDQIRRLGKNIGVECTVVDVFQKGGAGAIELAEKVVAAAESASLEQIRPLYSGALGIEEKVELVAKEIYGAGSVYYESSARKKLQKFSPFHSLPVCIAKTQSSLTDEPNLLGAPTGWTLTITDAHLAAGAGFIVIIAGNMMLMPGLSKTPQATRMDVDKQGNIIGLL
ncbi:MAG: formate--tetrahydrofolate ligase [Deltaproteobacteria bacterium]|nr:formate--tetrahydrofolate ligase [Deltaproteobacteria bacterium]